MRSLVAVAEYGLNPLCHIYNWPNKEQICKFPMDTTLKALSMAFSRDGKYLVILGGLPDFKISIFDLQNNKMLAMPETKLQCKEEEFISVSFNPKTIDEFCVLSYTRIYFYKLVPAFLITNEQQQFDQNEGYSAQLVEAFRLELAEFKAEDIRDGPEHQGIEMTSLKWDLYGRVTLCTNTEKLFQVTSQNPQVEQTLDLKDVPMTTVLTGKHMIVASADGLISWFKMDSPPEYDENTTDQMIKLEDEIEKEYNFAAQLGEQASNPVQYMYYSKSFEKLIIGTSNGVLAILPIKAEKQTFEEDDEDGQTEKKKQILENKLNILGRYHVEKINGIKELGKSTQIVSISQDETIAIWEVTTGQQLANMQTLSQPMSLDVSQDGKAVFIGSALGVFRVYDVSNRKIPRLVKQFKFYDDEKDAIPITGINSSPDGKFVVVTSSKSNKVFFMSQKANENFNVLGHAFVNGHVISSALTLYENQIYALCLLSNNVVQVLLCPTKMSANRMKPLKDDEVKGYIRKVDLKSELAIATANNDKAWFIAGNDFYLKKYTLFPTEQYQNITWVSPPAAPQFQLESHNLETTCYHFSKEHDVLMTGGKDGKVLVRNVQDLMHKSKHTEITSEVQTHSVIGGGVSALCTSKLGMFVYAGGEDGSISCWSLNKADAYPKAVVADSPEGMQEIAKLQTVEELSHEEIRSVMQIIEEEANRANEEQKKHFRNVIMDELGIIQNKLRDMLASNDKVTDIEKLERDEFVIDVLRQQQKIADGEQVCQEIRAKAQNDVLNMMLLHERLKSNTYDTMLVQSKACKSILSDKMLFNFSIRKLRIEEERIYKQIVIQRKIELMEKYRRIEHGVFEALKETEFSSEKNEEYFMNRIRGKPAYISDDAIAMIQEMLDKQRLEKEKQRLAKLNNLNQNQQEGSGKQKPIIVITKGRLGNKTKKSDGDESKQDRQKMQTIEIRGMEEIHWKVSFIKLFNKVGEDLKKSFDSLNAFDILYDAFDLHTNKRKRTQIEIIKKVIFVLKEDFNKEFAELEGKKEDCRFAIKEKNERIREILQNLKESDKDVEEVVVHLLEKPDHILDIDESEVPGVKYLTKEERAIKDEEERKIREREEALKGDNVQQRGLKTMMGGNELNLKKDKNLLENPYEMEDWMSKPEEQMNEDEKSRFKEFNTKKQDFEEKQRKSWRQQLSIHKNEVVEIKWRFEEALLELYKKRLFYEARIYEQELMIIRLIIFLNDVSETKANIGKFGNDLEKLNEMYKEKLEDWQQIVEQHNEAEQKIKTDNFINNHDRDVKEWASKQHLNVGKILEFVRKGKASAKKQMPQVEKAKLMLAISDQMDPLHPLDVAQVEKEIKEREDQEEYDYERDKPGGEIDKEQFDHVIGERIERCRLNKILEQAQKTLKNLGDFSKFTETGKTEIELKKEDMEKKYQNVLKKIERKKFNFEVIVYMRQGQVEVPQLPVATDYKDAILVQKEVITQENSEIRMRGHAKIREMQNILSHQTLLREIEIQDKILQLRITDFKERAKDVQLYRVTKQTQEIIQGKHTKRDEEDKKRLETQLKQLELNTDKRIEAINKTKSKLSREIRDKKQENKELENKARILKQQVDDRQSIIDLRSKDQADDNSDPKKRCKEISQQSKLLEVIQQQQEEMMFLKDELDRLRARTFPSFAHLQKPEYSDER